tara:strand:- start:714 stop:1154 length:441 start_codon:yes stop_codon:yes gene_type:complete
MKNFITDLLNIDADHDAETNQLVIGRSSNIVAEKIIYFENWYLKALDRMNDTDKKIMDRLEQDKEADVSLLAHNLEVNIKVFGFYKNLFNTFIEEVWTPIKQTPYTPQERKDILNNWDSIKAEKGKTVSPDQLKKLRANMKKSMAS